MIDKEILAQAMESRGVTQSELAVKAGVSRSTISTNIRRDNMGLDVFVNYLNLLGYSVVVCDKENGKLIPVWELEPGNTTPRPNRAIKTAEE